MNLYLAYLEFVKLTPTFFELKKQLLYQRGIFILNTPPKIELIYIRAL